MMKVILNKISALIFAPRSYVCIILFLMIGLNSQAQVKSNKSETVGVHNYITVKSYSGCVGNDVLVTVDIDNTDSFVSMQCDLNYPQYLTPNTFQIVLTDRKSDHTLTASLLGNNVIRLIAFSLTMQPFKGTSGAVIQIPFTINTNAVAGTYPFILANGIIGNSASQNIINGLTNGSMIINNCVGIKDGSISGKIEVFPNPTKDVCYVTVNKPFKNDFKVEVCNNFGQIMQTLVKQKGDNMFPLELTHYPPGIYLIRLYDQNSYFLQKVIKE